MSAPRVLLDRFDFVPSVAMCPKGCGSELVMKPDAIGRMRERCPKCDGVSAPRPRHPDDAMIPQGLVHLVNTLPPVAPGQLRCQRCADGVDGRARFCAACIRRAKGTGPRARRFHPPRLKGTLQACHYQTKVCRTCGAVFTPTGPRALDCGACR